MKILSNLLMFVLIISAITVIVTIILEIFYFPNILIVKILATGILLGVISLYSIDVINFMILKRKIEEDERKLTDRILDRKCKNDEH
ncbi:hypothetical protein K7E08_04625 [Ligilactobacillus salivarius]|uniref:hypothetical protein n=1 Tax=Ligilactobacillus salivarius TaxID=1624 RepID=UPI001CBF6A63|nr:hypothetical protein [Ligilactobacillus salivarius]MBZ4030227.1 hypothetical protein [Ligilactobacillus salivarius]